MSRQLITRNLQAKEVSHERDNNQDRYLSLVVGEEIFGVSILRVKEIIEHCELTSIPRMPAFICGALNLRGQVVPVIDLSLRLGKERTQIDRRTCIVVVELASGTAEEMEIGLMVDAVSQVTTIEPEDILPAPSLGESISTDFIHGMGRDGENFIILLKIDRVLSMSDVALLGEVQKFDAPADAAPADDPEHQAL